MKCSTRSVILRTNKFEASRVFRTKCSRLSLSVILHLFELITARKIFGYNRLQVVEPGVDAAF